VAAAYRPENNPSALPVRADEPSAPAVHSPETAAVGSVDVAGELLDERCGSPVTGAG
jgi:hypothetical protein